MPCRFSANWPSARSPNDKGRRFGSLVLSTQATPSRTVHIVNQGVKQGAGFGEELGYHGVGSMHDAHTCDLSHLTRARVNLLGSMCTALLIEFTLAIGLILRQITGHDWTLTSLAVAFLLVCQIHARLEYWIWGTAAD